MVKMSNTIQRRVILEELRKLKNHPSAEVLFQIVRMRLPRISLGTVYRNLNQLSDAGIILKLDSVSSQKRFDGNPEPHFHLKCSRCGAIEDVCVDSDRARRLFAELESFVHGRVQGVQVEFSGICCDCEEKARAEQGIIPRDR